MTARHLESGLEIQGYEIHLGYARGPALERAMFTIGGRAEGAVSPDGRVFGTHVHGVLANDAFRRFLIARLGGWADQDLAFDKTIEDTLDQLAWHLARHVDCERLLAIADQARKARTA